MLLTEDEAKTKRCQESFAAAADITRDGATYASSWHYPPPPYGTATAVQTAPALCIGSACMAWRWHTWTEYAPSTDSDGCATFVPEVRISDTHGYCGKVGKPVGHANPVIAHPLEET